MTEIKKYISDDSLILTDEYANYIESKFNDPHTTIDEIAKFTEDLKKSNKEQKAQIKKLKR